MRNDRDERRLSDSVPGSDSDSERIELRFLISEMLPDRIQRIDLPVVQSGGFFEIFLAPRKTVFRASDGIVSEVPNVVDQIRLPVDDFFCGPRLRKLIHAKTCSAASFRS